jgi:hypothetical protein
MKTFQEFCRDANIQENWFQDTQKTLTNTVRGITNKLGITKPDPRIVLSYQNYKPGVKNLDTGKFTPRAHTAAEKQRYGWTPVQVSSYSKADTPGSLTASGHRFDDAQRLVAVPYKSGTNKKPSIPFGTKLDLTTKPMGKETEVATTSVQDTGNFGPAGDYNKSTGMDLSLRTAQDLAPVSTSTEWGKRTIYRRTTPPPVTVAKSKPKK